MHLRRAEDWRLSRDFGMSVGITNKRITGKNSRRKITMQRISRHNKTRLARAHRAEAYLKRIMWFGLAVICLLAFYAFISRKMPLQSAVSLALSIGFFYVAAWCMPLERKFADSLKVRSSSSGTQSVSPIDVLLQDSAISDLELCNRLYKESPNGSSRSLLKIE
jgi:hypothetical protein